MELSRKIYDKIKSPFIKFCVAHNLTPNRLTLINHFITLTFGCWFFSFGTHLGYVLGLGVCLINGFLDYADGDVARETNKFSKLGIWLDSGFDVIIQNAVMGAIAIGCYKQDLPLIWIVLFFISNSANNFVSFNYNAKFGFDSDKGNKIFRDFMDKKPSVLNQFFKTIIDPTSDYISLIVYTFRYWITLGVIFNIMPFCFIVMTVIGNIKWVVMYSIYALYLAEENRLYILQGLAVLDEERDEFYSLRHNKKV